MKQKTVLHNLLLSLGAILCSLLIAAGVMLLVGYDPLEAYSALIEGAFGSKNAFANTLSKSIPLLFTGLAVAFANKGGIFNIGGEGQLYAGAMASTVTALMMQGAPRFWVIFCSFCAGMLA